MERKNIRVSSPIPRRCGGDSHGHCRCMRRLRVNKNKEKTRKKNIPGARDTSASRAPHRRRSLSLPLSLSLPPMGADNLLVVLKPKKKKVVG
jgi:hypothetical protein